MHGVRGNPPLCPKCKVHQGNFIHLNWCCPKRQRYWVEILQRINKQVQVPVPLSPLVCLLGAIDAEMYPKEMYLMITRLLYLARKLIARHWVASTVPTEKQWITYVNSPMLGEQLPYRRSNAAQKFDLI